MSCQCDEAQPICTFCEKRNLKCVYPVRQERTKLLTPPASSASASPTRNVSPFGNDEIMELALATQLIIPPWTPPPTLVTSTGSLSLTDMQLLHHWSTVTCNTLAIGEAANSTLQMVVPQLAFENDFLLNGILGIASLDMERLNPDSRDLQNQTTLYRGRAVADFRRALTQIEPGTRNYEAALVMSILLVVLYSPNPPTDEDELIILKWLIFYRGLSVVINMASFPKIIMAGAVGPFFRRELTQLKIGPVVPKVLVSMLQEIDIMDPDFLMLEHYCKVLDALGILYASLKQDGLGPELYIRIVSWCSYVNQEFTNCATERKPRAIIIMAHYLVFIKVIKGLWWLEGIPDRDIGRIGKSLGKKWLPYLEVPLQASTMTDKDEIAALLLR
jgi:Fungal specific transcription factor domain